jgi:DNA repair protein RecO (recombination protein O)
MARISLAPAYVLSLRPYRETSALLEVLTPDHGRVGLVARGVRGAKSKLKGLLQPFAPLLVSWSERGELGTLGATEAAGASAMLKGEAIFSGWYLNELVLRLLPRRDPHPALFNDYAQTLAALSDDGAAAALRVFEKRLLSELGYGVHLPDGLTAEGWYRYEPAAGLFACEGPGRNAYRGASLLDMENESFGTAETLRDARRLLRAALEPHLGGRELRTPEMLRALRAIRQ